MEEALDLSFGRLRLMMMMMTTPRSPQWSLSLRFPHQCTVCYLTFLRSASKQIPMNSVSISSHRYLCTLFVGQQLRSDLLNKPRTNRLQLPYANCISCTTPGNKCLSQRSLCRFVLWIDRPMGDCLRIRGGLHPQTFR